MKTISYTTVRRTNQDMSVTEFFNTPNNPNRTNRAITVEIEINADGLYSPVLEYGRNWQPTKGNAMGVASLVLGRPVIMGRMTVVG